jgi:hypothetical protein
MAITVSNKLDTMPLIGTRETGKLPSGCLLLFADEALPEKELQRSTFYATYTYIFCSSQNL